jgi:hypothetical protein
MPTRGGTFSELDERNASLTKKRQNVGVLQPRLLHLNDASLTPQGDVFRTADQVLTVEASHIHEAYIVVWGSMLRGFYLPVEGTFSPLSSPVDLSLSLIAHS